MRVGNATSLLVATLLAGTVVRARAQDAPPPASPDTTDALVAPTATPPSTPSTDAPSAGAPSTPSTDAASADAPEHLALGDRPRNMRDEIADVPMVLAPPPIFRGPDVEGFVARNVDSFGSQQFGWGGGGALYIESMPFHFLGVHVGGAIFGFAPGDVPAASGHPEGAFWWGVRLGLRFHWSALLQWRGVDAWVDVHDTFGRSGELAREGLDFGAGAAFSVTDWLGLGPFVRFLWASDPAHFDPWVLSFGLNVEINPPVARYVPDVTHETSTAGGHPHVHAHEFALEQTEMAPQRPRIDHEPFVIDAEVYALAVSLLSPSAVPPTNTLDFGGGLAPHIELSAAKVLGLHAGGGFTLISTPEGTATAFFSQVGFRFHWASLLPQTVGDGWIDLHHQFLASGGISRNGFDVGTGFSFNVSRYFSIGPFVRMTFLSDPEGDNPILVTFGLTLGIFPQMRGGVEIADADHDGVADEHDLCPHEMAGPHPDRENPGCADNDRDQDGMRDAEDQCPSEPAGHYPDRLHPGCPLPDSDRDGVPNTADFCPNVASGGHNDPLREGCPE